MHQEETSGSLSEEEEDLQTTTGVQCTDNCKSPFRTVAICSTITLQSSSAEQHDAMSEFDALSESEEPSEMAANTEKETTTRMYISPVQSEF